MTRRLSIVVSAAGLVVSVTAAWVVGMWTDDVLNAASVGWLGCVVSIATGARLEAYGRRRRARLAVADARRKSQTARAALAPADPALDVPLEAPPDPALAAYLRHPNPGDRLLLEIYAQLGKPATGREEGRTDG